MAIERGRVDRQLRELALDHAAGNLDDAAYLTQSGALRSQRDTLAAEEAPTVSAERAVDWLRAIGDAVRLADLPAERSDLIHAVYEQIVVAGPTFVSARLTPAAYDHGLALAMPQVVMARPTGVAPSRTHPGTRAIPIEGTAEWEVVGLRSA